MSDVIILDDALIAKVRAELSEMARAYPRSIAGAICAESFEDVCEKVARIIDTGLDDFEVALIGATARVKTKFPAAFVRRKSRTDTMRIF